MTASSAEIFFSATGGPARLTRVGVIVQPPSFTFRPNPWYPGMLESSFDMADNNGQRLAVRLWRPVAPVGVVQLIHGIGEHSGRYALLANELANAGYAVLAGDLIGHGRSEGKRGYIANYDSVLDSFSAQLDLIAEQFPGLPVAVHGHSFGGNLAASFWLRRKPEIQGLCLSAPWIRLAFEPGPWNVRLAQIMYRLYPGYTQASGLDLTALSRSPGELERYRQDPLVHQRVGPAIFIEGQQAGQQILERADEFTIPTLLMHGSGDRITSFQASEEFAERARLQPNFQWRPWPGLFHVLHQEPEREQILTCLIDWLDQLRTDA